MLRCCVYFCYHGYRDKHRLDKIPKYVDYNFLKKKIKLGMINQ